MIKKVVNIVIGGAGFIGTHLIHKLKKEGELAFSIDKEEFNFKKEKTDFIIDVLDAPSHFISNCFLSFIRNYNSKEDYEWHVKVWHCSSIVGVVAYKTEENELLNQCIKMNCNIYSGMTILDKYFKNNYSSGSSISLFFLSTSELYGNGNDGIIDENTPVSLNTFIGQRNFYVLQKYFAELQYKTLNQISNINVKVFRLFNIIGVGQRKEAGVIPKVISQMLSKKDELIQIKPDDTYGRSYLPVDYAVSQLFDLSKYSEKFIENIFSEFYLSDNMLIDIIRSVIKLDYKDQTILHDEIYPIIKNLDEKGLIKEFGINEHGFMKVFHLPEENSFEIKMRYFNGGIKSITKEEIIKNSKIQKYDRLIHKVICDIVEEQTNANR